MYFVYVLYSVDFDRSYVGISQNVEKRLFQHNNGLNQSTKAFVPWIVVHKEDCVTIQEARNREKYLKSAAGRRWRKSNIIWPRGATE